MSTIPGFRLPQICLPRPGIDLARWAVIACDQYTSEPAYWERVAQTVGTAASTLNLIFPEAYLETGGAPARIGAIQSAMRRYLDEGLLQDHHGTICVERRIGSRVRRGLMLELDLEHYDFNPDSTSLIRPTEGTIVSRLAPRIAVRRGAALELPHILVLIDDPGCTVIEPLAAARGSQAALYETELMLGGGHVAGYTVAPDQARAAVAALQALADPQAFARRYGVADGTPTMLFAVGDGNHSLATAKSIWNELRGQVGPDHPCRHALVEVENIHDPALEFAPIHRLLFGVAGDLRAALTQAFGSRMRCTELPSAAAMRAGVLAADGHCHAVGLIEPGPRFTLVEVHAPEAALAVATFQGFIDDWLARGGATAVDYIHGDEALERQSLAPGCTGFHLAPVSKSELLRRVVHDGPLPRKTFSMGEADEKRFYIEARRLQPGTAGSR